MIRVVQVCTLKQGQPFIWLHPEIMWTAECAHRALHTKYGRGSTAFSGRRFVSSFVGNGATALRETLLFAVAFLPLGFGFLVAILCVRGSPILQLQPAERGAVAAEDAAGDAF